MSLARSAGIEWLLHLDIDELWYSPLATCQRNAPAFFAALPPDKLQVSFWNHEAVPPLELHHRGHPRPGVTDETLPCWFEATCLFKTHAAFTRTPEAHSERSGHGEHLLTTSVTMAPCTYTPVVK